MTRDRVLGLAGIVVLLASAVGIFFAVSEGARILQDPKSVLESFVAASDEALDPADTTKRTFAVREGETAAVIGERLQSAGIIKNALGFRLIAEDMGVAGELAVGEYELSPAMRPSEIAQTLARGKTKMAPLVTFPEGWRSEEIAERVASRGIGAASEFMALVREGKADSPLLASRPPGASLEGYLFPDTYTADSKTTPASLLRRMVAQFEGKFTPAMREKAAARGMTVHEIVTLASIIEREAVIPTERPIMAGVFYNRLEAGMKLDTDPTVQYAVANADPASVRRFGWWKTELTQQDLASNSPYNTYVVAGLPPGPISNPGLASLEAAVNPTRSDYLYFVAKPDGSHAFARTLDEHNANVAKFGR